MASDRIEETERFRLKWRAIAVGTIILLLSFWAIAIGFVASETSDGPPPGPAFALGLALVPFVFLALASISRQQSRWGITVVAVLLAWVVAIPVSALVRDVVTGLVAGFGAGGIVALKLDGSDSRKTRIWAIVGVATFSLVTVRLIAVLALIVVPVVILASIGAADYYEASKAAQSGQAHDKTGEPT